MPLLLYDDAGLQNYTWGPADDGRANNLALAGGRKRESAAVPACIAAGQLSSVDNLTHSLAGAVLGRAGLYQRTKLAAGALIVGANLPDIDAFGIPFGYNLAFRRGMTHGPIAMLVLPLVLTALLLLVARLRKMRIGNDANAAVRPSQLLILSYIGVLSHPALDWLNTYGIRLLMPFDHTWFYGDSIFIIDVWIWIALGIGVVVARRRWHRAHPRKTQPARVALVSVVAYIALMMAGSNAARRIAHDHVVATESTEPVRIMAGPVPINPFARELIVDMGDRYEVGRLRWTPSPTVTFTQSWPTNSHHPAVRMALAQGAFGDFLYWSRFPLFTVQVQGDSARVEVGDARFAGRPGIGSSFSEWVVVPVSR